MNRRLLAYLAFLVVFLGAIEAAAAPRGRSHAHRFVIDDAKVLTDETKHRLSGIVEGLEEVTTWEVFVVTTRREGEIAQVAQDIFVDRKIGKKDKNNGVLVLYHAEQDRFRVHTGYGADGTVPDAIAKRIVMQMTEARARSLDQALIEGTEALAKVIHGSVPHVPAKPQGMTDDQLIIILLAVSCLILIVFMLRVGRGGGGGGEFFFFDVGGGGDGGGSGGGGGDSGGGGAD